MILTCAVSKERDLRIAESMDGMMNRVVDTQIELWRGMAS